MADAVVGALRVVLGADTAAFTTALKEANSRLQTFQQQYQALGARLAQVGAVLKGAAVVGAVVGVGRALDDTLGAIKKLGDSSVELGIPVDKLSALKHAAAASGASFETLNVGLKTLARNMSDVAADGFGPVGQAFRSIGVAVTDSAGKLRSSSDVVLDIADKMAGMRDGAGKTALAMKLFGEQGAAMLPMLNRGSVGIGSLADEARALGRTIDDQAVGAAKRYKEAIDRISAAKEGWWLEITSRLAPSLARMSEKLAAYTADAQAVESANDRIGRSAVLLENAFASLSAAWDIAMKTREVARNNGSLDALRKFIDERNKLLEVDKREINAGPRLDLFASNAKGLAELKKAIVPLQGQLQALRDQFNFDFSSPWASVATKMEVLGAAWKKQLIPLQEYKTQLRQLQVEEMAQLREAAKRNLEDGLAEPMAKAKEKMGALAAAVRAGTISFEDFSQRMKVVSKESLQTVQASIDAVTSGMSDAFRQFTETGKFNFRSMTKSILADLAQLIFRMNVLKPLFGDGDMKQGLIGSAIGKAFSSGSLPGFADGGRPQVGMPSWVGERGKELWWPDTAGTVIPNHVLRDAAGSAPASNAASPVNLSIDARGATVDAVARLEARLPKLVLETFHEARTRGLLPS